MDYAIHFSSRTGCYHTARFNSRAHTRKGLLRAATRAIIEHYPYADFTPSWIESRYRLFNTRPWTPIHIDSPLLFGVRYMREYAKKLIKP